MMVCYACVRRGSVAWSSNNSCSSNPRWMVPLLLACIFLCGVPGRAHSLSLDTSIATTATTASTATSTAATTSTPASSGSIWSHVEQGPLDAILGIAAAYRACQAANKVNICVGAYRDMQGNPWVLPSVRQAEEMLLAAGDNKEYLPIDGDVDFIDKAVKFAYGTDADLSRIAAVQSLSGTGACRIGGEFIASFLPGRTIYIPTPTWGNHWKIFATCGLKTAPYRYYSRATNSLDLDGLLQDIQSAPDGSVILLHACAHNPTGCDPDEAQWQTIADAMEAKNHVAFFDSAYQGFASGNAERDAAALRSFVARGTIPVLLAQSFAKNFGLYGERCGTLSIICAGADEREHILSQLRCIIRPMYSSPPRHGSSIVKTVLGDTTLSKQYYSECQSMAERIQRMRVELVAKLIEVGSTHDWSHITRQIGMFAFTGMSVTMCEQLMADYNIFLTKDGRISLAGLNDSNLEYVASAIHAVTDGRSITSEE